MIFFLLGSIGHLMAIPPGIATLVWPASGFALAMVFIFGREAWVGIFLGAFFVTIEPVVNTDLTSFSLPVLLLGISVGMGCLLQSIFGAWLIQRILGKNILKSANTFMLFSLSIPFVCFLSSSIGTVSLYTTGFITVESFLRTWTVWWLGDTIGILLITPFLLLLIAGKTGIKVTVPHIALYLFLIFSTLFSFGFFFPEILADHVIIFLSWPVLLIFALKYEPIHTTFAMLIVSVIAITLTYHRMGLFHADDLNNSLFLLQIYLIVTAVTSMTIATLSTQQRRSESKLMTENQERVETERNLVKLRESLEAKVQERTQELQEELVRSQEKDNRLLHQSHLAQMGEMISMIAHQWRQPLSSISAIAGTLSIDVMMDEYKKEFFQERLDSIAELSQHLSITIDDFRNFFKTDKEIEEGTLMEVVESSLQIIEPTLTSKSITVKLEVESTPIKVHTYINEVKQVVLNILKNSEDIMQEQENQDGKIWIKCYTGEGCVFLSIEDNAGGVPEGIIEKIFDPYFSTKTKKDGTGLGLYMSKVIIEEHCKGMLSITNTQHGAKFTIELPIELI